ncbi:MAG: glutathione-dependent formaldehyde dehydrogenase [Ignavibacteria bacterium]|nr:glutathione-dependent formaldehyde dehydrogenase [Ignavibacteria bacterium]
MKAAVFHKPHDISYDTVDDPKIKHPRDIILKVTSTAICGSDLHLYNGYMPQASDLVMGHEFMGIIEEVGAEIKNLKIGDRVIVPFLISCGSCWFCSNGAHGHCENSNPENYGPEGGLLKEKGGGLFGYTDLYGGYDGGQAEYVRVPYADMGVRHAPEGLSDEKLLFLTDIFPTGYSAIEWSGLKAGETVAVFGCGPVGLMAQKVAQMKGAGKVIGLDVNQYRLDAAKRTANSETVLVEDHDSAVEAVRSMTDGRGADLVVDAVGMEADKSVLEAAVNLIHVQAGSINALKMALSSVRRAGRLSVMGVYGTSFDNFPLAQIFDKGIRISIGQATVLRYIDDLIDIVKNNEIVLDDIITHTLPLSEVSHAYDIFANKKDNCVKVVMKP